MTPLEALIGIHVNLMRETGQTFSRLTVSARLHRHLEALLMADPRIGTRVYYGPPESMQLQIATPCGQFYVDKEPEKKERKVHRLFVYPNLKQTDMLDRAGIDRHGPAAETAEIPNYREVNREYGGRSWPTMAVAHGRYLQGELINVTRENLEALDRLEPHYCRALTQTTERETAWLYVLRPRRERDLMELGL